MLRQLNPNHKASMVPLNQDHGAKYRVISTGYPGKLFSVTSSEAMTLKEAEALRDELQQRSYANGFTHGEVRYAIRPI